MSIMRISAISLLTVFLIPNSASAHCDGKHTGAHPHCDSGSSPPPPPPESCADATGEFPAFAYSTMIFGGKRGTLSGFDLHLANSDGNCSIKVLTNNAAEWLNVSYRQNGDQGRLVWSQSEETGLGRRDPGKGKSVIRMLDMTVENGELSASSLATVFMEASAEPGSIADAELSPDGNTIFYSFEESDGSGGWVHSIHSIDVSSCTSACPSQVVVAPSHNTIWGLSMNSSGQRLYFSGSGFGVGLVEIDGSTYSSVRTIASASDPQYIGSKHFEITVGSWDFDGDGSANEVVAFSLDNVYTVDILDVTNCAVAEIPSSSSCLADGDSSILRTGIAGYSLSFHANDLLIESDGGYIKRVDSDSLDETVLLQGYYPDSVD